MLKPCYEPCYVPTYLYFLLDQNLCHFSSFQFKIVNLKLTMFQKYHLLMRFSVSEFYFCTFEGTKSSFISHSTLHHLPLSKFSKILNLRFKIHVRFLEHRQWTRAKPDRRSLVAISCPDRSRNVLGI